MVCPMYGDRPYRGGSVMGGSTIYHSGGVCMSMGLYSSFVKEDPWMVHLTLGRQGKGQHL